MDTFKRNLLTFLIASFLTACASRPTYELVIQDVGFFDGEKDLGRVNIAINADTIAAISKTSLQSDSVIDGTGKYIVPGLVNSHVHVWESGQLTEAYQSGVLANMGMHASSHSRDSTLKSMSAKNGFPYYYSAGVAATVPGGHPTAITPNIETVNDSISVEDFVNHRIREDVDYIKVVKESNPWFEFPSGPPSLAYDSIAYFIEYAHSKGLKVVVHIGSLDEMVNVARLKPDGIVHMWYSAINAELTEQKLKTIKESGAFIVPTAIVNQKALQIAQNEGGAFASWSKENFLPMSGLTESIRRMHDAGITLLAGTDNGNFDLNWGDDLINELIIYSQSGMNNLEVLKTATGNAARAWGIPVGLLHVGSQANMLLINGNPLKNLEQLRDIHTIWKYDKAK